MTVTNIFSGLIGKLLFPLLIVGMLFQASRAQHNEVFGIVYQDVNRNGTFDEADEPLNDIRVSNMSDVYTTDRNGEFTIPVDKPDIVFVIKPTDFEFPLRENNVPDFYYLHYPEGTQGDLKYKGVAPTGSPPDTVFFPLYAAENTDNISANIVGDPQIPRIKENTFFRQDVVPDMLDTKADFSLFLGDLADNNLDIFPHFEESVKPLDMPLYMVFGNHDTNYRSPDNSLRAETYRSHFGPDYYAFNYGKSHFIVLNNVDYNGWNIGKNRKGGYFGGIDQKQMKWFKQNLAQVDSDKHIYLISHIPIHNRFFNKKDLEELLEPLEGRDNITHLSGHLHRFISWEYDESLFWNGKEGFRGYSLGAASGAWWSGPFGQDSIPEATCNDGMPNGFFDFTFRNAKHQFDFIPAGKPQDFQLRISEPHNYVHTDSLANSFIIANVFAGDERCRVTYHLDHKGEKREMMQFTAKDPFVVRNNYRRINRDDWNPGLADTPHLWKAPLPEDLSTGPHIIHVKVTFPDGKKYEAKKIFEVRNP